MGAGRKFDLEATIKQGTGADDLDLDLRIALPDGVLVFHAGTKRGPDGALVTAGGRVLTITGVGDSLDEAHGRSLAYAREVLFKGKQFRSDIGWRELVRRAGTP